MKLKDLSGSVFGRLSVLARAGSHRFPSGKSEVMWRCLCQCGAETDVMAQNLKSGHTQSCGCFEDESRRQLSVIHGEARRDLRSAEFETWAHVVARCTIVTDKAFRHYGGRGITVCDRWRVYEDFLADMGRRPSPEHSIDRIDNDGNYEPANCRWATAKEQARNRRGNRIVAFCGVEMSLAEACERADVPYGRTIQRLNAGWSEDRALSDAV